MKTKLLRKIRKQFVINYYPDGGFDKDGKYTKKELLTLDNLKNDFESYSITIGTVEFPFYNDALNYYKELIIERVKKEWSYKIKSKKISKTKVWYNQ